MTTKKSRLKNQPPIRKLEVKLAEKTSSPTLPFTLLHSKTTCLRMSYYVLYKIVVLKIHQKVRASNLPHYEELHIRLTKTASYLKAPRP